MFAVIDKNFIVDQVDQGFPSLCFNGYIKCNNELIKRFTNNLVKKYFLIIKNSLLVTRNLRKNKIHDGLKKYILKI